MPPHPKLVLLQARFAALVEVARLAVGDDPEADADLTEWADLAAGCTRQASIRQLERDFLVRWNEGVGAAVEAFWAEVARRGIEVPRKQDIVADTLKRGRVLRPEHFEELEDHFEELQTCGKISPEEADRLNELLDRFEANPKNFEMVRSRF